MKQKAIYLNQVYEHLLVTYVRYVEHKSIIITRLDRQQIFERFINNNNNKIQQH